MDRAFDICQYISTYCTNDRFLLRILSLTLEELVSFLGVTNKFTTPLKVLFIIDRFNAGDDSPVVSNSSFSSSMLVSVSYKNET